MCLFKKLKNMFRKQKEVNEIQEPEFRQLKEPVYINLGVNASKKYHNHPNAHNMEGAVPMERAEADAQGYKPCSKCFKNKQ
jgi:hypothetical protein